jgi:group I intron endonuclease
MSSGVYVITNTKDGKRYVGISRDIETRLASHRYALRRGRHTSSRLQAAWNEAGEGAFSFEILELCDYTEFSHKEPEHIKRFRSNEPEYGYNKMFQEVMRYSRRPKPPGFIHPDSWFWG